MLTVIFTLDYEIHGNGEGSPYELMVEPTQRMMALFERYGAKLTIMADVAEILKFREYKERFGRDDCHYEAIANQLREAIRRGHDVQLHLHSSYFNARFANGRWEQDWSEYDFAGVRYERMREMVHVGKDYLERLLKPVSSAYECKAFRAANWSVSPSRNVVRALVSNQIRIDTSVFKYGRRDGLVKFDYSHAPSNLVPWPVAEEDICRRDDAGKLLEIPIYCECRWVGAFLTGNRIYRALTGRAHQIPQKQVAGDNRSGGRPRRGFVRKLWALAGQHAWKADFNQCTGRQLRKALLRASRTYNGAGQVRLPFVLIGHSKLFTRANERSLESFLDYVVRTPGRHQFGTFSTCRLEGVNLEQAVLNTESND